MSYKLYSYINAKLTNIYVFRLDSRMPGSKYEQMESITTALAILEVL